MNLTDYHALIGWGLLIDRLLASEHNVDNFHSQLTAEFSRNYNE